MKQQQWYRPIQKLQYLGVVIFSSKYFNVHDILIWKRELSVGAKICLCKTIFIAKSTTDSGSWTIQVITIDRSLWHAWLNIKKSGQGQKLEKKDRKTIVWRTTITVENNTNATASMIRTVGQHIWGRKRYYFSIK